MHHILASDDAVNAEALAGFLPTRAEAMPTSPAVLRWPRLLRPRILLWSRERGLWCWCPALQPNATAGALMRFMLGVLGAAFGWGPENAYVSTCNAAGVYVHASDYCTNLAALSNARGAC